MLQYIYRAETIEINLRWNINGLLSDFATAIFLDGLQELLINRTLVSISLSQRVDGTSGTTTVQIYKVSTAAAETLLGSVSLASGGGGNARNTATINLSVAATDRLGIKATAFQVAGQDASLTAQLL